MLIVARCDGFQKYHSGVAFYAQIACVDDRNDDVLAISAHKNTRDGFQVAVMQNDEI